MKRMKTFRIPEQEGGIPLEPKRKTKPVRVDRNTIIMVPEGADVEAHKKKYQEHEVSVPGWIPWW